MKKLNLRQSARLKLRLLYLFPVLSVILAVLMFIYFNLSQPQKAMAATESVTSGSFIINMGVVPQTYKKGLRPYGMIYDLLINYNVPIKWIIDPSKSKDGTDFTYASKAYKGGPFIIPAEYITPAVKSRISYWIGQGVSGVYITSGINVPVHVTLTNFPKIIVDTLSGNQNIIANYFSNAAIPASAYSKGVPAGFSGCDDLWVNPHADPTWSTHRYLYNLAVQYKAYIWCQCHAVSVMEGLKNPSSPFERLNFLSTNGLKCYSNNKCGISTETHSLFPKAPFIHKYAADPVMQFMGTMNGAANIGSELYFIPQSNSSWRPTTLKLVTTSDGVSPREGVIMAYGPAFGNPANGYVMYESGHNLDAVSSTAERVAAQRAFFNFVLLAGKARQILFNNFVVTPILNSSQSGTASVSVSAGTPPYNYSWSSSIGGSFSNPNGSITAFTAPNTNTALNGIITCVVTDACGRKNFSAKMVSVKAATLPISLLKFKGEYLSSQVKLEWITASEINNDYFEVQRSSDGIDYSTIGKIKGQGNSSSNFNYSFIDNDPGKAGNYYRLQQIDFDGRAELFNPVYIKYSIEINEGDWVVSPNPFKDNINLSFNSDRKKKVTFSLLNQSGAIAWSQIVECQIGVNSVDFNELDNLSTGIYYAVILDDDKRKVIKLIRK